MNFNNKRTLEQYFKSINEKKDFIFPADDEYVTRYNSLASKLHKWIHGFVVKGAMSFDGGYLNDHGPDHIKKVILIASEILLSERVQLTEYESYILLMAIQIHDIGNIYGRVNHEINSLAVIEKYKMDAGDDRIEWDCIFDIAEAHGGNPKNKICGIQDETILNFPVRKRLLAAVLKFADELAEDRTRASRFQLQQGLLPPDAELYHKYSYCLHTVRIDHEGKQILLSLEVEQEDLCRTFQKSGKPIYLLDEIYERTFKTHLERMYCMRFMRDEGIQFDKIKVHIQVVCNETDNRNKRIKKNIIYELGEVGYPNSNFFEFFEICPDLKGYQGKRVEEMLNQNNFIDVTASY